MGAVHPPYTITDAQAAYCSQLQARQSDQATSARPGAGQPRPHRMLLMKS